MPKLRTVKCSTKIDQGISRTLNLMMNLSLKSSQTVNLLEVIFEAVAKNRVKHISFKKKKFIHYKNLDYQRSNRVTVPKGTNYLKH